MKVLTLKDLKKPLTKEQEEHSLEIESSYRRGYLHGYSTAQDDAISWGGQATIGFFNNVLTPWRYFKDKASQVSQMVCAPEFDIEQAEKYEN